LKCRYAVPDDPKAVGVLIKTMEWHCERCGGVEEEAKQVVEASDRVRIIRRLLALSEDYDLLGMRVEGRPDELVFHIRLPEFDLGEARAIQHKQRETGFITVEELIKVQRAGYKSTAQVPPKPQPRSRATLRERARQRAFYADPRPP